MTVAQDPAATLHQESLADYVLIRTDQIDVVDRLREIDLVWADALGSLMRKDGQDTAIGVCRLPGRSRWTLVFGAHRHRGAELHDIVYLKATVVSADREERRLREARENLFRSDLSPIDRAAHIAEIVAIKKRRAGIDPSATGPQVGAAARWQASVKEEAADATATLAGAYGFTEAVAFDLGLSGRTVERGLMLYRRLAPSLIARLRTADHAAAKQQQQLEALAKLEGLWWIVRMTHRCNRSGSVGHDGLNVGERQVLDLWDENHSIERIVEVTGRTRNYVTRCVSDYTGAGEGAGRRVREAAMHGSSMLLRAILASGGRFA